MTALNTKREFTNGVLCPLITPFKEQTEEIDFNAFQKQVVRIASARMGLVLLGTNGEASHLSDAERSALIRSAREALDKDPALSHVPITAGTGTGSARETVRLSVEAKAAGADYVIVIPPGYFAGAIGRDKAALKGFFTEVFDHSPLPVMVYNFPGAASGIDLDSDFLIELSEHQNCFGAKLTCAGIGKGYRLSAHTSSVAYKQRHPQPYFVLPGFSDILLPALISRATGCITGTGNLIPKTIVKLYDTAVSALQSGNPAELQAAMHLQDLVAEADWAIVKAGIGGTKYALNHFIEEGLGGVPRKPLQFAGEDVKEMLEVKLKEALEYERSL